MNYLLKFILQNFSFIYSRFDFRFVDSLASDSFGDDAYITLSNDVVQIRLVRDRGQLFCDFKSVGEYSGGWFSIDLVRVYLTGESEYKSELDQENVDFIKWRMSEIEAMFAEEGFDEVKSNLERLKVRRSKRLFG